MMPIERFDEAPAVAGFIEGIMLLAMTQEEFNEKHGKV